MFSWILAMCFQKCCSFLFVNLTFPPAVPNLIVNRTHGGTVEIHSWTFWNCFCVTPFLLTLCFKNPSCLWGGGGVIGFFFFFFFTASECRLFTQPDTESESSCCGGCIEFSKWVLSLRFEHHLWFWPQSGSEQQTNAHLRRCCWSVFKQAASGAVSMEIAFVTTLPTMLVPEPWPCNRCRPLTTHKRDRCWGRQHCQ